MESEAAFSVGVKVPFRRIPLAWAGRHPVSLGHFDLDTTKRVRELPGRKPGCFPKISCS